MTSLKRPLLECSSRAPKKQHLDSALWIISEKNRTVVEECEMEFLPTDGEKAREILETIRSLGWCSFVKSPGDYVREIILEFYTNLNKLDRTSKVKGPDSSSFPDAGLVLRVFIWYNERFK
uniref:Uncharacterized protein isoform X2 n=1 Tax=Nicotiana tabacum TaxID=4097 RepID=A0A1S4C761_TOBAC|nr:PREDICTED: uncharacterized protein LOC107815814 isoform X2 [Nicotiana tabacum]XP_016496937.1 PREDICTED: uncharacterized protein LOC107815814 isoform X2 [Nicotiana tabacum]